MIVWMKRHARELKGTLDRHAGEAVAAGSVGALVGMAFFAVLREGFETAVFLVATFQSSNNTAAAISGAVLGLATATLIGALFYRGGARINLAKFFRITSALLVIVAAGLVSSAFHTAHEAGWLNSLQTQAFDMSWLVEPGSVRFALLNGMFGMQSRPVVAEVLGWLIYLIPVMTYVLWPSSRRLQTTKQPLAA
jgi:high-affinity iron transporter